jgi:putative transposase
MPDHIRLLITTRNISEALRHVKGGFSRRLGSKFPAWQPGFTDHLILDSGQFHTRRDYIHQNPTRARDGHSCGTLPIFVRMSRKMQIT